MNNTSTLYVGLDVHKESITVAYAINSEPVELMGKIGTTHTDIERLCKRLQSKSSQVSIVYEAGPCGYGLYRRLVKFGFDCMVCAPSLIPKKPGDRVKTDRRDAIKLVRSCRYRCKTGSSATWVEPLYARGLITRRLSNSNPARPYICRFSIFRRFTCPSTTPLLHLLVMASHIAAASASIPAATR